MKKVTLFMIILAMVGICDAKADDKYDQVNHEWQNAIVAAIDSFPQGGGYYTGRNSNSQFRRTAWRGMNEAFGMQPTDSQPRLDVSKAQPSFCSMATYLALLKAITIWDATDGKQDVPNLAWFCFKPFCGVTDIINHQGYNQADGEGLWGMANANGPGIAVLVKELGVGFNFAGYRGAKTEKYRENKDEQYLSDEQWQSDPVWDKAQRGDFMKIFWNRNETASSDSGAVIGDNGKPDEENGPGKDPVNAGYSVDTCSRTAIQRVVFSRITRPEKFADANKWRASKKHKWLNELAGKRHGTTKELKKYCGID